MIITDTEKDIRELLDYEIPKDDYDTGYSFSDTEIERLKCLVSRHHIRTDMRLKSLNARAKINSMALRFCLKFIKLSMGNWANPTNLERSMMKNITMYNEAFEEMDKWEEI